MDGGKLVEIHGYPPLLTACTQNDSGLEKCCSVGSWSVWTRNQPKAHGAQKTLPLPTPCAHTTSTIMV
jgi:hypothetical protein